MHAGVAGRLRFPNGGVGQCKAQGPASRSAAGVARNPILSITGKGNKGREAPLIPDLARPIGLQGGNFLQHDVAGESQAELPLIRRLGVLVAQWNRGPVGELVDGARKEAAGTVPVATGINALLKRDGQNCLSGSAGRAGSGGQ